MAQSHGFSQEVMLFKKTTPMLVATFVAFGCSESAVAPTTQALDGAPLAAGIGRVIHRVSVGGPDVCEALGTTPGCDKNFSLVALEGANGVKGQWTDRFSQATGGGGIHVTVNCLVVDGNEAWISGVDDNAPGGFAEWTTMVRDNGTSANDPADQIGFSVPSAFVGDCNTQFDFEGNGLLNDAPQGQVSVR